MKKEIGSNFWIHPDDLLKSKEINISPEIFNCYGQDKVWLSSCRSGISMAIDNIEINNPLIRKKVLLSAFTCHTVYEPFRKSGYEISTIPIETNLQFDSFKIIDLIKKENPGILLIHNYFGFDCIPESQLLQDFLKGSDVILIEDVTQVLYSNFSRLPADYFVGSIRKWCGVPDGGFIVSSNNPLSNKPCEEDYEVQITYMLGAINKYNFISADKGEKEEFMKDFLKAKDLLSSREKAYLIGNVSLIIQSNLDIEKLKSKRRQNYFTLINGLNNLEGIKPVFTNLKENETPLYFPIICRNRTLLQKKLANNNIFAPIIWPKGKGCPTVNVEADYLYDNLLCLPLDQRYDKDDMERIVSVIKDQTII